MIARYVQAGTAGTLMTFSLLWIMQALLAMTNGHDATERTRATLDWVRLPPPEDPPRSLYDDVHIPPAPPAPDLPSEVELQVDPVDIRVPGHFAPLEPKAPQATGIRLGDGPLVSLTYVSPVYPAVMLAREVEGWVLVEFDVTSMGIVANVRVVESSHPGFERSAIRAARKSRFKPHVIDGEPMASTGIRNVFRFEIEN